MQMNFAGLSQVRRTIHSARREVLLAVPRGGPALDGEVDLTAARTVAGAPGVSVRVYLPPAGPEDTDLPRCELAGLAKQGVEVHTAPAQNPRMVIVDRSVVVLARNRTDYGDGALIGHGLPFTPMLVRMLTSAAQGDDHEPRPAEEPLTPLSREILRQLSRGAKDEAAARDLGMALRTYRRAVARLMNSLDATSRFQAGYAAAQRNWL
ncbi:hypothetical protein [Streptomyces anulatus]|uniref:hypothetical protein n=1 Tax=Streptomyces anulatus TaxID=1892 RepID=UPI003720B467